MEICTVCMCCLTICNCGDEATHAYADHCENCGSLCEEDELMDGYCDESECTEEMERNRGSI